VNVDMVVAVPWLQRVLFLARIPLLFLARIPLPSYSDAQIAFGMQVEVIRSEEQK